jgi:hypothetical protein
MKRRSLVIATVVTLLCLPAAYAQDTNAIHVEPWYDLIHEYGNPDKVLLSIPSECTATTPEDGWEIEYGRAPDRSSVLKYQYSKDPTKAQAPIVTCVLPDGGEWHVGLVLVDDSDGIERIILRHEGEPFALIRGTQEDDDFTMYVANSSISTEVGDTITIHLYREDGLDAHQLDAHRLRSLVLWRDEITMPPPSFHDFTVHTMDNGDTEITWWSDRDTEEGFFTVELNGPSGSNSYPDDTSGSVHRVIFDDLQPGSHYQGEILSSSGVCYSFNFVANAMAPVPPPSTPRVIPLRVDEPTSVARSQWPVVSGVPFPPGELSSTEHLSLWHNQTQTAMQADVLSYWEDHSIQWVALSFLADTNPRWPSRYELQVANTPLEPPVLPHPVVLYQTGNEVSLENGLIRVVVGGEGGLFDRISIDRDGNGQISLDERVTQGDRNDLVLVADDGQTYSLDPPVLPEDIEIVADGPMMAEVHLSGWLSEGTMRNQLMRYRMRVRLFADNPILETSFTLDVTGPEEMNKLQRLSVHLKVPEATLGTIGNRPPVSLLPPVPPQQELMSVLQDYDFSRVVNGVREGNTSMIVREDGYAVLESRDALPGLQVVAGVEDFWQTYPKAFAVFPSGLRIDLMPKLQTLQYITDPDDIEHVDSLFFWCVRNEKMPGKEGAAQILNWREQPGYGGQYELRRGLRPRSTIRLSFSNGTESADAVGHHLNEALFAAADPDVYLRSTWFGEVDPVVNGYFTHYENMFTHLLKKAILEQYSDVRTAGSGTTGPYGAFGFMNYGDAFPESRQYNWTNQEYDYPWAALLQFARTGRTDLLWFGERGARHLATIDIRHHIGNKLPLASASYAGLPWKHSIGHTGGFFSCPFYKAPDQLDQWVNGCQDPLGHVVLHGLYTAGFLAVERDYVAAADRAADTIAGITSRGSSNSPWGFEFTNLRRPGWIINNMVVGYNSNRDPYLLNTARMARNRSLIRQTTYDPVTDTGGGIPVPIDGTGFRLSGNKTFTIGVFGEALRRLDRISPDPRTASSLRDLARYLIHTNYKPSEYSFWYYNPMTKTEPFGGSKPKNENNGTIVMSTLAEGFNIEPEPEMYRVKNVLMFLVSRFAGAPENWQKAAHLGYASHSFPEALHLMKEWGFANTAGFPGPDPEYGPGASDQYPSGPGAAPLEVCGDGFDNDNDGLFDESGFLITQDGRPMVQLFNCPEPPETCTLGELAPCGSDVGACQSGLMRCVVNDDTEATANHWGSCGAGFIGSEEEILDGIDNDCDGVIDEGL